MKTNGEVIQAKITEVGPAEIKYKKFNFQDGPTYVENRSDIRYLKYSNGITEQMSSSKPAAAAPAKAPNAGTTTDYYDPNEQKALHVDKMQPYGSKYKYQGRRIGENEMHRILMKTQDREIVPLIQASKDAHKLQFVGFAAIPLGIAALYVLETGAAAKGRLSTGTVTGSLLLLGGAIACPIISGVYKHKRNASNRKAVELYNQKY